MPACSSFCPVSVCYIQQEDTSVCSWSVLCVTVCYTLCIPQYVCMLSDLFSISIHTQVLTMSICT